MHTRYFSPRLAIAVLLAASMVLLASACSSDSDDSDASPSATATMAMDDTHQEAFDFGEPADAADADRTIEIDAADTLRFDPDAVTVDVGETVTFKIHNSGQIDHEFVLATETGQDEHEEEMQQMAEAGGMEMHDDPNAISVAPGETAELTWTFTEAGTVLYGCHEPGHYAAGMKGTITVS